MESLPFSQTDRNVQGYLLLLKAGKKPAIRPDCGQWKNAVDMVEATFEYGNGNAAFLVESLLDTMINSGKYPGLAALLFSSFDASSVVDDQPPSSSTEVEPPALLISGFPELPESAQLPTSLSDGASAWLDEYVKYSKLVSPEGYEDFHEACGLWVLSTVAGRRIKIPFTRKQYTPLMVLLVADSTLYAKSETADVGVTVLQAAGLRWLLGSDRTTPQKLLSDMAGVLPKNYGELEAEKQYWIQRRLSMSAQRGWRYDEFGELVRALVKGGGVMEDLKGLLLQLDACADQYEYATQSRGAELIEKPYLSLLGCMTPPDIRNSAKTGSQFWSDGFWARFAFVTPPVDSYKDCPFSIGEIPVPYDLWKDLKDWHTRLGEPTISVTEQRNEKDKITGYDVTRGVLPEVKIEPTVETRDAWIRYRSALKKIASDPKHRDLRGSYGRLPIKAIRIAALLASLENAPMIEMRHWAKAQEITERWRKSLHELYHQVNHSELEPSYAKRVEDDILKYVKKLETEKQPPTVRDLSRYMTRVDVGKIKQGIMDLIQAKLLVADTLGRSTRYRIATDDLETEIDNNSTVELF
jgi:hypothetical protein